MAKDSSMSPPLTEPEFQRQFAEASRRGAARRRDLPLATSVQYDTDRGVTIELNNNCRVCVPLRLLPELAGASPKDLRRVEILGVGQAIAWPTLDQQFDVLQLLAQAVGTKVPIAKLGQRRGGGRLKTKSQAPRANGTKEARPRKRRQASP
jgi:hypothetical protein